MSIRRVPLRAALAFADGRRRRTAVPRWWGRHLHEIRWQAELGRLLVDPVYRGQGVPQRRRRPRDADPRLPRRRPLRCSVMRDWLRRDRAPPARVRASASTWTARTAACSASNGGWRTSPSGRSGRSRWLGHSRGGRFAKALAHRRPELVFQGRVHGFGAGHAVRHLGPHPWAPSPRCAPFTGARRFALFGCLTEGCGCDFAHHYRGAVPGDDPAHVDLLQGRRRRALGGLRRALRALRRGHGQPRRPRVQPQGLPEPSPRRSRA